VLPVAALMQKGSIALAVLEEAVVRPLRYRCCCSALPRHLRST